MIPGPGRAREMHKGAAYPRPFHPAPAAVQPPPCTPFSRHLTECPVMSHPPSASTAPSPPPSAGRRRPYPLIATLAAPSHSPFFGSLRFVMLSRRPPHSPFFGSLRFAIFCFRPRRAFRCARFSPPDRPVNTCRNLLNVKELATTRRTSLRCVTKGRSPDGPRNSDPGAD